MLYEASTYIQMKMWRTSSYYNIILLLMLAINLALICYMIWTKNDPIKIWPCKFCFKSTIIQSFFWASLEACSLFLSWSWGDCQCTVGFYPTFELMWNYAVLIFSNQFELFWIPSRIFKIYIFWSNFDFSEPSQDVMLQPFIRPT